MARSRSRSSPSSHSPPRRASPTYGNSPRLSPANANARRTSPQKRGVKSRRKSPIARSRSRSSASSHSPPRRASPTYGNSPKSSPAKFKSKRNSPRKRGVKGRKQSREPSHVKSPQRSRRQTSRRRSASRRRASPRGRKRSSSRRGSRSRSRRGAQRLERARKSRSRKGSSRGNDCSASVPKPGQLMDEAAVVRMMKKQFELEKNMVKHEEPRKKIARNGLKPMPLGEPVVFGPEVGSCDGAVIFLHGLGDRPNPGKEFKPVRNKFPSTKWVHLRAPKLAQPFKGGKKEASWGLMYSTECMHPGSQDHEERDKQGIYLSAAEAVRVTVEDLHHNHGVPIGKVVICGFSQGAAVSLLTALSFPSLFAGCISCSGWLLPSALNLLQDRGTRAPPIAICHGSEDPIVGYDCAEYAASCLTQSGIEPVLERVEGNFHAINTRTMKLLANYVSLYLTGRGLQVT